MASARFAWGIDVGNRALKAVKLVREGDQLRVDDFELIEHESVLSNAGDNREQLIQTALASFVQRHPMKGGVVAVGVSGQQSFARFIKLPPVEEKKIPEIVRFEAIQQIPFPLDDVEWSYQLFRQEDSPDVEVGIFAMRKELVNQHIKYFTDFDLNVQVVQMNPLAVYNAMWYDQRLNGTTMIIDLGAENTDLIIADKDTIWMRSIPIGGNNFTQTLEKAFKLPFAKAEDLKRNAATSKYARQIFQAMRPVFADLVAEIQRSIGFYASVHRDSRIRKIMALGGTFRLPGLQKYLQQNLQLDVERPDNLAAGAPADPKLASTFNENLLSVVGAYGLAVQAMGDAKITSSLLPGAIRREKMWKEKTKWFAAAAALFVVGTGIPLTSYFIHNMRYESNAEIRGRIDQTKSKAENLDQQWSSIETAGSAERQLMANIRSMIGYRDLQRNMLLDLDKSLPQPQAPVKEGLLKGDASLIKQIPRDKREMVVVESVGMKYFTDMAPILSGDLKNMNELGVAVQRNDAMEEGGIPQGSRGSAEVFGEQPPPAEAAAAQPGQRGYLVALKCTSPHENAMEMVEKKLIPALLSVKPTEQQPTREFAFAKAAYTVSQQIKTDAARMAKMKQDYDAAARAKATGQSVIPGGQQQQPYPGMGEGGPPSDLPGGMGRPPYGGTEGGYPQEFQPGAPPNPEEDPSPYLDRLTKEDTRDDWAFTVLVAVTLDPPPPQPADPAAAAAPAQ